jgi:ABC-2 type transport system permease protein
MMNFETFYETAKISLKDRMSYRGDFVIDVIIGPFVFLVIQIIWTSLYSYNNVNVIQGFTLSESLSYFALSAVTGWILWTSMFGDVGSVIKYGEFARYALMPVNFFQSIFSEVFGRKLPTILIKVPLFFILLYLFFNIFIQTNPVYLLLFFSSIVLSFLLFNIFMYGMALLTFWQESYWVIGVMASTIVSFLSGSLLPLEFYPSVIRRVVEVLPFKHFYYSPIMIYLGKYSVMDSVIVLLNQAFFIVVFYLVSDWLYNKGRSKFTSQGG